MRPIGFSTGALAGEDFRQALCMIQGRQCRCVELSALREKELQPLLAALPELKLAEFDYVSFHVPSRLEDSREADLVDQLRVVAERKWPIVLHPDVIQDYELWARFGALLCIENMDKRKPIGRNVAELNEIFGRIPEASLCFDIGHCRQVDPTMSLSTEIVGRFGDRIRQLHLSEVNTRSRHERLNDEAVRAFRKVAYLIPEDVPVILETPINAAEIDEEIEAARLSLESQLTLVS